MNPLEVFNIRTKRQFEKKALEVFRHQARENVIYKKYVDQLRIDISKITYIKKIPFLPIDFFKTHRVTTKSKDKNHLLAGPPAERAGKAGKSKVFLSSGTTGTQLSRHCVSDISLYEKSLRKSFEIFYGDVKKYTILAFLPSYYENKNSSLLYMVNDLMKRSGKKENGFYKTNAQEVLFTEISKLLGEKKKVILFGVSHALLDLALHPSYAVGWEREVTVIETGGMKGRHKEITREELHQILREKFGVKKIHSEYGMTELLSQAYSKGNGLFNCPPWMKVLIRDVNDPFSFLPTGKSGAINIIDLANINSCSFIATQDVGRIHKDGSFEVLGRMDNSDLRGCNLLAG